MPSMSYCRWTNLLADLQDCYDHIDEQVSPAEAKARDKAIALMAIIAEESA